MAEALPHQTAILQPICKPKLPGSLIQLDITPEKSALQKNVKVLNKRPGCHRRVAFAEREIAIGSRKEEDEIASTAPQQYPSLDNPQLNSTYGVARQIERLKLDKIRSEKTLVVHDVISDNGKLQFVNEKSSTAVNFKRKEKHFSDLVPVDIDKEKDLEKAAPKRTTYEAGKCPKSVDEFDIMNFWTNDLITDNPKLDYDKDIDQTLLQPDTSIDTTSYLTDLYFCKEIASQFR